METINGQFEDPALKAAIRRAWGAETAPADLRHRVLDALSHDVILQIRPTAQPSDWRSPLYGLAAAAVLLLGVGLLALEARGVFTNPTPPVAVVSVPPVLGNNLTTIHLRGQQGDGNYLFDGETPRSTIRTSLSRSVGIPIPAFDPGNGWTLERAGTIALNGTLGAQLVYTRGDQQMSIIAVPAHAIGPVEGGYYVDIVHDRPVLGTTLGQGTYWLIADGGTDGIRIQELTPIRNQLLEAAKLTAAVQD